MSEPDVRSISLNKDQALVLFELVIRLKSSNDLLVGEREVLNDIECALERQLEEPFRPDYLELVAQARSRLTIQLPD